MYPEALFDIRFYGVFATVYLLYGVRRQQIFQVRLLRCNGDRVAIHVVFSEVCPQRSPSVRHSVEQEEAQLSIIKQIKSKFDNADIHPPKTATEDIEKKIGKLKLASQKWTNSLHKAKMARNFDPTLKKSVSELVNQANIVVEPTDKTSKIAVVDRRLVEQKLLDHLESGSYERLPSDPSANYEKELEKMLCIFNNDEASQLCPKGLARRVGICTLGWLLEISFVPSCCISCTSLPFSSFLILCFKAPGTGHLNTFVSPFGHGIEGSNSASDNGAPALRVSSSFIFEKKNFCPIYRAFHKKPDIL